MFVPIWSTGFIGGKFGLPYAEPYTFLFIRYALVVLLIGGIALAMRAPWPKSWREAGHIGVSGFLMHGVNIGCVFDSIHHGLPAGVASLIVGLQPLLTAAVVGRVLGERVSRFQWLGLILGLAGVALVVGEKLSVDLNLTAVGLAGIALLGITAGTVYQKRFCPSFDLRTGLTIQHVVAVVYVGILALTLETRHVEWSGKFIFAVGWLVLVLSIGAMSLLFVMIRRGAASRTAALFYLVPASTALIAYFLFNERLGLLALCGMALTAIGVFLATRTTMPPPLTAVDDA
ncbi:MAG: DMT family transporter [Rhodospirillales bacterium]